MAVTARVLWVLLSWHWQPHAGHDNFGYTHRALYLWEHSGHLMPLVVGPKLVPDAYWPPVYPIFLALLIAFHQLLHVVGIPGPLPHAGAISVDPRGLLPLYRFLRLVTAAFGAVTVPGLAWIAFRLFGTRVAVVACLLVAVYPPLIYVSASLYSEALFVPLLLWSMACMVEYRIAGKKRWLALSALLCGLGLLTHSDGVAVVAVLLVAAWRPRRNGVARSLWAPAAVVGIITAVVAPWAIRNALDFHAFIPLGLSLGPTLADVYNHISARSVTRPAAWVSPRGIYPAVILQHPVPGPAQSAALEHSALTFIARHPSYVLKVWYWNTVRLFELNGAAGRDGSWFTARYEGVSRHASWLGDVSFWVVGVLAISGAFTRAVRRVEKWIWLTPALMYFSVVLITTETPRFRAPIDPFLLLLAAAAAVSIESRVRARADWAGGLLRTKRERRLAYFARITLRSGRERNGRGETAPAAGS